MLYVCAGALHRTLSNIKTRTNSNCTRERCNFSVPFLHRRKCAYAVCSNVLHFFCFTLCGAHKCVNIYTKKARALQHTVLYLFSAYELESIKYIIILQPQPAPPTNVNDNMPCAKICTILNGMNILDFLCVCVAVSRTNYETRWAFMQIVQCACVRMFKRCTRL